MKTWIYTVLIKRFYFSNGVEYSITPTSADIDCFTSHDQACKHLDSHVDKLCAQGYHITDSDAPDDDSMYSLMVRLEDETGQSVVLELAWKIAEGPVFSFQDRPTQAPSKSDSKQT